MISTTAPIEALLYSIVVGAPLAFGCVEPWSRALLELACFSLALLCLFKPERRAPSPLPLAAAAAVLILGAVQLRSPSAADGPRPGGPFTVSAFATGEALLLWAAYAALVWSAPRAVRDPAACRRFARVIVASGVLVSVLALLQRAASASEIYFLRYVRSDADFFGPFFNRDHAASYLAVCFSVGAGLFASRMREVDGSWRAAPPDWLRAQTFTTAALSVIAAALAVALSRGALLGLVAGAGAAALFGSLLVERPGRRRALQAGVVLAFAGGLVLSGLAFERQLRASDVLERSAAERLSLYASGLRMLRDAPVFGFGLGASGLAFGPYQDSDVIGAALFVHNDWLQLALDCGLVGAGLFAALGAAFWLSISAVWRRARSREMRALIGGGLAALAAFAAHCLVDFPSQVPANAVVIAALAGWLSGACAWADKGAPAHGRRPRWRWALAPVLGALAAASLKPAAGAWYARRAELSPLERRPELLARAAAWDARPRYDYLMGLAMVDQALARPGKVKPELLTAAFEHAKRALAREPLNPFFLELNGAVLWQLGRKDESRRFAERAQRLRFEPASPEPEGQETDETRAGALRDLGLLPEGAR